MRCTASSRTTRSASGSSSEASSGNADFSWRRHALETLAVFAAVYHGQVQPTGPVESEAPVEVHQ